MWVVRVRCEWVILGGTILLIAERIFPGRSPSFLRLNNASTRYSSNRMLTKHKLKLNKLTWFTFCFNSMFRKTNCQYSLVSFKLGCTWESMKFEHSVIFILWVIVITKVIKILRICFLFLNPVEKRLNGIVILLNNIFLDFAYRPLTYVRKKIICVKVLL